MTDISRPLAVSITEAARLCGVSRPTLARWTNLPGFPCARIGGRVLIPLSGLEDWLNQQAAHTDTTPPGVDAR